MKGKSPLFRVEQEENVSYQSPSPLLSNDLIDRRFRRDTTNAGQPKASRSTILQSLFRNPATNNNNPPSLVPRTSRYDTKSAHEVATDHIELKSSQLSWPVTKKRRSSWSTEFRYRSTDYWRNQFEARKAAGKNSILTEIEILSSSSIWILLFLPICFTLATLFLHNFVKWEHRALPVEQFTLQHNGTWTKLFTSPSLEKYHGFVRTHFHIRFHNNQSDWDYHDESTFISISSSVQYSNQHNQIVSYQNLKLYPVYIMKQFVGPGPYNATSSIKIPLPFLSLENIIPRDQYSPWKLVIAISSATKAYAENMDLIVESSTLSRTYFYIFCVETICICVLSLVLCVMFCQRLRQHALHAWTTVSKELPYLYQRQLTSWHFVLPEQYACVFALVLLSIWCNPFKVVSFLWMMFQSNEAYYNATPLKPSQFWMSVVVACAGYGFLCTVVGYIHGLRFNSNAYEEKYLLQLVKDAHSSTNMPLTMSSSALSAAASAAGEQELLQPHATTTFSSYSGRVSNVSKAESLVKRIHSLYILPHHILSVQFLDFFLSRLVWFLVSCVVVYIYYSVMYMHLWKHETTWIGRWVRNTPSDRQVALWVAGLLLSLLTCTWLLWFGTALWRTGRLLRVARIATSRLRQISYRALSFQLTTGAVLAIGYVLYVVHESSVLQGVRLPSLMACALFATGWLDYVGVQYALLPWYASSLAVDSMEWRVFVATVTLTLVYSLLPPRDIEESAASSSSSFDRHLVVPLRCQQPHAASAASAAVSQPASEAFCLETACQLLEVAYQTYFASEIALHRDSSATSAAVAAAAELPSALQPSMDLRRLGLGTWATCVSPAHSTFGLIACHPQLATTATDEKEDEEEEEDDVSEHVVAFRGSTLANIAADFYFALMPLPSLKRPRRFLWRALSQSAAEDDEDEDEDEDEDWLRKTTESVPLLNEHFPRVHIGFWQSYASLRDAFLEAQLLLMLRLYLRQLRRVRRRRRGSAVDNNNSSFNSNSSNFGYGSLHHHESSTTAEAPQQQQQQQERVSVGRVYFTGHSLGAAMTLLAALELAVNLPQIMQLCERLCRCDRYGHTAPVPVPVPVISPPQIGVYLFGCPRIGNAAFVDLTRRYLAQPHSSIYRVQVDGDLVTMVPKFLGFYRHVGCEVLLDDCAAGSVVVAPSVLESSLFKSSTGSIANHSLDLYRQCLEACFEAEERREYLAKEELRGRQSNQWSV